MKKQRMSIRALIPMALSFALLVGLVACSQKRSSNSSGNLEFKTTEPLNQNSNASRQRNKVGNLKKDLNAAIVDGDRTHPYAREISVFRQMSRIYQEAWFVAINDKRTFVKNIFEKAALDLSKLKERQMGFPLSYLQWKNQKSGEVEIRYNFGNISQLINVRSLLIRPLSPRCNIMFDSDNRVQRLNCEEIGQNLVPSTSVDLLFDKLQFKGSNKFLLQVSGRLMDLESELEKIEFKVKYNVNFVTVVKTNLKRPQVQPLVAVPIAQPIQPKVAEKKQPAKLPLEQTLENTEVQQNLAAEGESTPGHEMPTEGESTPDQEILTDGESSTPGQEMSTEGESNPDGSTLN